MDLSPLSNERNVQLAKQASTDKVSCREIYGWVSFAIFLSAIPAFMMLQNYYGIVGWVGSAIGCLVWTLIVRAERRRDSSMCCPCSLILSNTSSTPRCVALACSALSGTGLLFWSTYNFYIAASEGQTLDAKSQYLAGISSLAGAKWSLYCLVHILKIEPAGATDYTQVL